MVGPVAKRIVCTVSCLLCLVQLSSGGTLQDVELIPEEMRSLGSDLLGKSLSLGIGSGSGERLRRNPVRRLWQSQNLEEPRPADLAVAGSQVYSEGYGDAAGQAYGGKKQAGEYYNSENSGAARGEVGFFGRAGKKGIQDRASNQGYQGQEKDVHNQQANSGFYNGANGASNLRDVGQTQQSENEFARNGQGIEKYSTKGGHRKGHHKSGFTNSYHKDESGSKSDFFDDAIDEGDQFVAKGQSGLFNERQGSRQHGRVNEGAYKNEAQGKKGDYDQHQNFNDKSGQRENYARDRYNQDQVDYGRQASGKAYNKNIHDADEHQNGNHFVKNGKVYGQRQAYVPIAPIAYQQPIAPVVVDNGYQRNYYPVNDRAGLDLGVDGYQTAPVQAYQQQRADYYPSATVYYPVKADNFYVPARNGRGKTNVQVLDNYEDPVSNERYYVLPQGGDYYPARAY